jgi:hypothetical protein
VSTEAILVRLAPGALALALILPDGTGAAKQPPTTQSASGKTYVLPRGASLMLRLSGRWTWTEPRVSSQAIELVPVEFFADPGYRQWTVVGRRPGTATIRSAGRPACGSCGLSVRAFRVTIVVPR